MTYRYAHRVVLPLLVLLVALPAAAQDAAPRVWAPIGPPGGVPQELLRLADGGILAAAPGGALFTADSPDGEITWRAAGAVPGVPTPVSLFQVAPDPVDPAVLYATDSHDVLRSSDGGATWDRLPQTGGTTTRLVALSGEGGTVLLRIVAGAVQRSLDRGATWQPVDTGLEGFVFDLEPVGADGVLVRSNGGLARSHDAGARFETLAPLPGSAAGESVVAVAAAPSAPQRLFVLTGRGRTLTSVDGGESWQETAATLPFSRSGKLRVDDTDPDLLYAVWNRFLYVSRDGGASWLPGNLAPELRAVLPLPGSDGGVLAATSSAGPGLPFGGVYRSHDAGRTWLAASGGLQAHFPHSLDLRSGEPSTLLAVVEAELLRRRPGTGWSRVAVPRTLEDAEAEPAGPPFVRTVRVAPRRPERWLVAADVPVEAGTLGTVLAGVLQVSDDGGTTWTPQDTPAVPVLVAPAPSRPHRAYLTGTSAQDRPIDFCLLSRWLGPGDGFDCLAGTGDGNPAAVGVRALAVDAADADRVYSAAQGLWVSADGGSSWTGAFLPFPVSTVAAHPLIPGLVAVGGRGGEVWRSEDGGATWTAVQPIAGPVDQLLFDPVVGDLLYAVADGEVWASEDGGRSWTRDLGAGALSRLRVTRLAVDGADPSVLYAATGGAGVWRLHRRLPSAPCVADDHTLCLGAGDRFRVRVAWQDFGHAAGYGRAVPRDAAPGDADTGAFWFFDEDNLELLVKVIDGADVNRRHWVFYGALTNVPFTLVVTDTLTGERVGYLNPARRFASRGDTTAFPEGDPDSPAPPPGDATPPLRDTVPPAPCTPSDTTLCLGVDERFRVGVTWEDFQGGSGTGTAVPETGDTGFFWFFKESNLELAVKVLDGRPVNGNFWVFYGALTNVPFRLTVTDTVTGQVRTYVNPSRNFASRGDVDAFEAAP